MFRIGGDFLNVHFPDMAGIICFDILYAIVNVFSRALGEQLNAAVRQIADKTGELMAMGHPVSGKAKADALNSTRENDVSGNHFLMDY
jgi:hypothetical protein